MTLRTPRRRISPRAKRRYRAIREFFRRALGSSQQDIKINSSIAVNVTDLKHKIVGIESQLHEVNRHCRDLVCLENNFRRDTQHLLTEKKTQEELHDEQKDLTEEKSKSNNTQLLYKHSSSAHRKSDRSDYVCSPDHYRDQSSTKMTYAMSPGCSNRQLPKIKNKKNKVYERISSNDCDSNLRKHKAKSTLENLQRQQEYSNEIFHSLSQPQHSPNQAHHSPRNSSGNTAHRHSKKADRHREYVEYPITDLNDEQNYKEVKRNKSEYVGKLKDKHVKSRKIKHSDPTLDDDFIADIIKRQYKPVKLFGRRNSDVSQFSAPVCRDQEYSIHEDTQEGTELCSCCYEGRQRSRYVRHHDLSDMRSICDTRLYSTKPRKHYYRRNIDNYNDSAYYDIIPVKEKSSPKSRRKFIEDNFIPYNSYYKEVPPSPRTLRPRLNLKAQYYTEYDDHRIHGKVNRILVPVRSRKLPEYYETYESDITSETIPRKSFREIPKVSKSTKIQTRQVSPESGTLTSLQYPVFVNDNNGQPIDNNLNKTQDTDVSADKADKALCEIKDILQNFLQEIKKDSSTAQCEKSEGNNKVTDKQTSIIEDSPKLNTDILQTGNSSFNTYNGAPCVNNPYMPPFSNPCCYPVMPICPMNCMQNPYVMPSPSFTCQNCSSNQKETICPECSKSKRDVTIGTCDNLAKSNETEDLIKEIYKFVAQSPLMNRKKPHENKINENFQRKQAEVPETEKNLTSRSVGSSSRTSRHDAKVGTPTMKCYSKSCEAIGSRMNSDTYYTTTTHSDTVLEKLSLEQTTQSDSDISMASASGQKVKKSRFHKVMQSLGLFKKKRKESSDDVSDSESTMEVNIKSRAPYKQNVTNYMMHEQAYFRQPPVPGYGPRAEGPNGYVGPPYERRSAPCPCALGQPVTDIYMPHRVHHDTIHEHAAAAHCRPPPPHRPHPHAPGPHTGPHHGPHPGPHPYPPHYDYPPPQPYCDHAHPPRHYDHPQRHYDPPPPPPQPHPQPPVCLQEIEVKSTGTQSERKMSFFRKFTKGQSKVKVRSFSDPIKSNSTQTKTKEFSVQTKPPSKGIFAGFRDLQEKIERDPVKFQFKTQNKLKTGDMKIKNAMLQKMLQRKNPFSPRNLLIKSLMGNNNKDRPSFGERPQLMYRPRFLF